MRDQENFPTHFRGIEVPGNLRPNWNQPEAFWWCEGVKAGAHLEAAQPKSAFFEKDKFYRFDGIGVGWPAEYVRYEIKEIFETPQDDDTVKLQAHAEAVGVFGADQVFLGEAEFKRMIKM